jgi:hypothetical protein
MSGDKIYGSSFNPVLVRHCARAMKSERVDSVAQPDSAFPYGFT